ncbi:MAG: transcription-repair coupling factor [Candidatus Latescibacterota bacterium]|jgi:transcription-repair coupling factor (superfamily II helicase)
MDPAHALDEIARRAAQTTSFREVTARLRHGERRILVHGLPSTLAALLAAHVFRDLSRPVLVVAANEDRAEEWRDDLQAFLGEDAVRYFPAWDIDPYDRRSPDPEITGLRLEAAARVGGGTPAVVVAPAGALLAPLIPPYALELGTLTLEVRARRDPAEVTAHLVDCGFERVAAIDGVGQFSARGGILDVYPFGVENPYRLEFFDDEVESIRLFDAGTQRSLARVDRATILPAREVLLASLFHEEYRQRLAQVEPGHLPALAGVRDQLELGGSLEGVESYLALLYGSGDGLFEYLPDPVVFCDDRAEIDAEVEQVLARPRREYERHRDRGTHLPPELLLRDEAWLHRVLDARVSLEPAPLGSLDGAIRFGATAPPPVEGELRLLRQQLLHLQAQDYTVHLRCETQGQCARLQEIVGEWSDQVEFGLGSLHQGFVYPEARLALFNDHEIFTRQKRHYRYRRFKTATPLSSFSALQRGDFVVHVDHGIGRYLGIKRLRLGGREHDCLTVAYQGEDRLFVPVEQLDRLRKYSSAEGDVPLLSRLGGTAWEKLKERTREEIFKMAGELVQLYAERKALPGFQFSADTPMQRQVEAAFPFQETPDQLRTVEEVKQDMELPHPMDRLVCGDVGYGKTEVAVRAALKAVADHRQVAVLVPTTILAQQHYHTFCERLASAPVRIEVLSRFRTAREQQQTVRELRTGKVDIVIGTHRLLSKDVVFRDLGLVVVDEEQRFGVRHKEKLKQLKRQVDVLTLTATPIPRTLHMSLMGARDMSVINTPPQDRLPIHTEILAFDEARIMEAIHREVERGGQVYVVHNRVQSINRLAQYLQELLPQIRVAVAHGQMAPRQLEQIMLDFLERKYDCLVCTMIIESGIDIPSVNTVLVNRADTLGLSQLYQIRGRVGRSNERAYAYLLVPKGKKLTKKSRMRLRAIEEFADLGSGVSIAMRDMEIRGAGNLVGAQQHGFITAVGFDLYCRLLEEAMRDLRGEQVAEGPEPELRIPVSAYIPDEYVADGDQKMEFYQRLADARRVIDLLAIREELEDRFGRLPFPARALMHLMEIRVMARQLGLERVQLERSRLRLTFGAERTPSPVEIQRLVERASNQLEFAVGEQLSLEVQLAGRDEIERLEQARDALQEMV